MRKTAKPIMLTLAACLAACGANAPNQTNATESTMTNQTSDRAATERAKRTVLDFLQGLEAKDMEQVNGVWAENGVQEMPYTPQGVDFPSRVEGRKALIAQYSGWPQNAGAANFTDELVFHETQDPNVVIAEYRGVTEVVPTGRTYDQRYIGVFRVNDAGKIELFREYFDPNVFAEAFGMTPDSQTFTTNSKN